MSTLFRLLSQSVAFITLAMLLPADQFGILAFGASVGMLAATISDYGLSLMVIRDISQQRSEPAIYLGNVLSQKLLLSLLVLILGNLYLFLFIEAKTLVIGNLYLLFGIVNSFIMSFTAIVMARNRYGVDMIGVLVEAVLIIFVVIATFFLNLSVLIVAAALLATKVMQLLTVVVGYSRSFNETLRFHWDREFQYGLLKRGWSFSLFSFASVATLQLETQFLAATANIDDVGVYQAIFRIALLMALLVTVISNVWLPVFSKEAQKCNLGNIPVASARLSDMLLGIASFAVVFCAAFSAPILQLIYGARYNTETTTLLLPLLTVVVAMRLISSIPAIILTAMDKQKYRLRCVASALIFGAAFNGWLTPRYGLHGAAAAALLTHLVMSIQYQYYASLFLGRSLIKLSQLATLLIAICLGVFVYSTSSLLFKLAGLVIVGLSSAFLLRSSLFYLVKSVHNHFKR